MQARSPVLRDHLQAALGSQYTLERELEGGGMSRVFIAQETALARRVVLKVLSPEFAEGVSVARFRREIQLAAQLSHPHIVPVLSAGDAAGLPYYAMPLVEGESLRKRLVTNGALSIGEVLAISRDVAKALAYAHDHNIVHRDIKPDNVLLSAGSAVVTDFGIAKAIAAARADPSTAPITRVGTSIGTLEYMAPEQAAGDPQTNHLADLYAFGVMTYELLAGRTPFHNRTPQALLAAHMSEAPRPIRELRADTPPELAALVMQCLAKQPGERPSDATALVQSLDAITSGVRPATRVRSDAPPRLRRALAVNAVAATVVLVLVNALVRRVGLPDGVFPASLVLTALGLTALVLTHLKIAPLLTWRRMILGNVGGLFVFALVVGAQMALRSSSSLLATGAVEKNEQLVVADFSTRGGVDSALGAVAAEAIRTDLTESKVVRVMPASAIRETMREMRRAANTPLNLAVAREIAERRGVRAVVDGDLTSLGSGFVATIRLVAAETGDELTSFRQVAEEPNKLIPALERLSRSLRERIGESLRDVRATPQLANVTTGSLDALKKYREAGLAGNTRKAIPLLEEAVAIDSNFAMAWRLLWARYSNFGYPTQVVDSAATRAFRARDHLKPRERALVEAVYYDQVLGDRAKTIAIYERLNRDLGVRLGPEGNLALYYVDRREFARAETLMRQMVAAGMTPSNMRVAYENWPLVLFNQGKISETDSVIRLAEPEPGKMRLTYMIAQQQLDSAAIVSGTLRLTDDRDLQTIAWSGLFVIEVTRGRIAAAMRALARARSVGAPRDSLMLVLLDSVRASEIDALLLDRSERAVKRLDASLARIPLRSIATIDRPYFRVAAAYAKSRRPDRARAVLAQFDSDVRDTIVRRRLEHDRRWALGEIALAEGRPLEAVSLFRQADLRTDGYPVDACAACLYLRLARAFDAAQSVDSATFYFERYLTAPFFRAYMQIADMRAEPIGWVHYRLGELYDGIGDRRRAATHYQQVADLWKDADAELQPKVAQARQRAGSN